ncbi:hypothetical protein OIU76_008152 [Salix suchowensis]|nr:hypothetical protein OIU76_008152 [Salix suchowensis]
MGQRNDRTMCTNGLFFQKNQYHFNQMQHATNASKLAVYFDFFKLWSTVQCQNKHASNYPTTHTNYTEEYHFFLYNNRISLIQHVKVTNQVTIRNIEPATKFIISKYGNTFLKDQLCLMSETVNSWKLQN